MTDGLKQLIEDLSGVVMREDAELIDAGKELLDLLRIHAALERIAATGAEYSIRKSKAWSPLVVWFARGNESEQFGEDAGPLTADIAEAGAAWAEAQVAPKLDQDRGPAPQVADDNDPQASRDTLPIQQAIERLLNAQCAENGSNTPDFILAKFLCRCLDAFDAATTRREDWYGHRHYPGGMVSDALVARAYSALVDQRCAQIAGAAR